MRMISLLLAASCLASCATLPGETDGAPVVSSPAGPVTALQPQELRPGQCAVFLFERRPPNRFVLFEDLDAGQAQIVHDGRVHRASVSGQRGAFVTGEAFSRAYVESAESLTFTLEGEVGEETGSGPRLENVLLSVIAADGQRIVRPLAGVRSCGNEAG